MTFVPALPRTRIPAALAAVCLLVAFLSGTSAGAQAAPPPPDDRIGALECQMAAMAREIEDLKAERRQDTALGAEQGQLLAQLQLHVDEMNSGSMLGPDHWLQRIHLGGYGEIHANFSEGGSDKIDIHRLVLYLGVDFNDWIKFHSETEIEHAFVSDDSGGELGIEQAYVDFLLSEPFNVRVGRILTPLGIINKKHEPPTFNGVERPSFAKFIIPSTWSSDGIGVFGSPTPSLTYEAYVVGGLDGSMFNAMDGIRKGRIKERPSLNDPAVTGRLDWYPFAERVMPHDQRLRVGVSGYYGGLDHGDITIGSADFEYSVSRIDLRGAVAGTKIDGAKEIGSGTAEEMFGWYLDLGYHFWPDSWKTGKLSEADAVAFVRYDDYDTQHEMPSGVARNPKGDRTDLTLGVNFYLTPDFVLKADYQFRDDESGEGPGDLFNFGVGWQF